MRVNFNSFLNTPPSKILSKRGNVQQDKSVCRRVWLKSSAKAHACDKWYSLFSQKKSTPQIYTLLHHKWGNNMREFL